MKKIKYSQAGQFTDNQKKLCKEIADRLKLLKKSGCSVIAKQNELCVYLDKEIEYSHLLNIGKPYSNCNTIPYLSAGNINDSGADDSECFIDEILDEEDEENEEDY